MRIRTQGAGVMVVAALCQLAAACAAPQSSQDRTAAPQTQVTASEAAALEEFTKRVTEYAALHRRLAKAVGELDETKNPAEIAARETRLGDAIRAARAQAKPGDLFMPAARVLQKLMADDARRHPPSTRRSENDPRDSESADFQPVVNQTYPPAEPLETFPADLLHQLPPLPEEVEYRMVARYLILFDVDGNVILDFIPRVAP